MACLIPLLVGEKVLFDHLSAHKELQREGREHIHPKAETCHIDQCVIWRKVVQYVALSLVGEDEKCGDRQCATRNER